MTEALVEVSFEEYLAGETARQSRSEYVTGRIFAMAGGSERHDVTAQLIYERLAAPARAAGCRPFIGNRVVQTRNGSGYYPDVLVVCGDAPHPNHERDAVLIFEVLSPSTESTDRREKAPAYATLPSLTQYVLVNPYFRRFEVAEVGPAGLRWRALGSGDRLLTPYQELALDDLYDDVDRFTTT